MRCSDFGSSKGTARGLLCAVTVRGRSYFVISALKPVKLLGSAVRWIIRWQLAHNTAKSVGCQP
jgi:hypothetical protein